MQDSRLKKTNCRSVNRTCQLLRTVGSLMLTSLAIFVGAEEVLFTDGFEAGTFGLWTRASTTPNVATITTARANTGTCSAYFPGHQSQNTDRYAANLARPERFGAEGIRFTFWMYDDAGLSLSGGRVYGEIRSFSGDGWNLGQSEQVYAAGKFTSVTVPGEVYDPTKYQGRGGNGVFPGSTSGWFNLSEGPNRSIGWHIFEIRVETANVFWYVDGHLARIAPRGDYGTLDCVVLGSNLVSSYNGDPVNAYFDDVTVTANRYSFTPSQWVVHQGIHLGGGIEELFASDNRRFVVVSDEFDPNAEVDYDILIGISDPQEMTVSVETGSGRSDLGQYVYLRNHQSSSWELLDFHYSTLPDRTLILRPSMPVSRFVQASNNLVKLKVKHIPFGDIDAADGWANTTDYIGITVL